MRKYFHGVINVCQTSVEQLVILDTHTTSACAPEVFDGECQTVEPPLAIRMSHNLVNQHNAIV